jgi:hypothetical protein
MPSPAVRASEQSRLMAALAGAVRGQQVYRPGDPLQLHRADLGECHAVLARRLNHFARDQDTTISIS